MISPKLQERAIRTWAKQHGQQIVMLPAETDASGGDDSRPILLDAISRVESGELDGIAVWKLDRLTRSLSTSLKFLEQIEKAGGELRSASEEIDATTPSGRTTRNIFFSIAQGEREEKALGFEKAKADAVTRGIHISGWVPLGYRKNSERRLEPDPESADLVRRAFEMRADGASWRAIAEMFSVGLERPFYGATVSRLIENPVYLGEARQGKHRNPKAHEPLVTRAEWDAAQIAMPRPPRGKHEVALLAGIVRCAGCSRRMTSTITKGRREYRCRRHGAGGFCSDPAQITGPLVEPVVEETVLARIEEMAVTATERNRAVEDAERDLAGVEAELVAFQDATAAVGDPDAFAHGLRTRLDAVEGARQGLAEARGRSPDIPSPATVRELWPTLDGAERNQVLRGALDVVWVRRGRGAGRVRLIAAGHGPAGLSRQGTRFTPRAADWPTADLPGEVRPTSA